MIRPDVRAFLASALAVLASTLAGCGGSPGASPNVVDPAAITVQPASAVIYPGVATTLVITGGTGSYVVVSDNQAIIPIATAAVGHSLTVIANPVTADTVVNLTVRDTGTTPQRSVALTVRPGTIANAVSVVPASSDCTTGTGANTVTFLCSGGEALVTATISQAGIPLPARGVRFEVVSGDVRFITTPPGTTPEILATSLLTTSDQAGLARVRLRALPGAPNQSALIQITDPETGAFLRVVVRIAQFTGTGNAVFFAVPDTITFTGPFAGQCAANAVTDVVIFGGTPPYNVVNANGVIAVSPAVVTQSGGAFRAQAISSACFTDAPITITDAAGRTIVVRVSNVEGTGTAPPPAVSIAPPSVTITCNQSASFVVSGGQTPIAASSNNGIVTATVNGRTVTVTRIGNPPAGGTNTSVRITVTDGNTTAGADVATPATCAP